MNIKVYPELQCELNKFISKLSFIHDEHLVTQFFSMND